MILVRKDALEIIMKCGINCVISKLSCACTINKAQLLQTDRALLRVSWYLVLYEKLHLKGIQQVNDLEGDTRSSEIALFDMPQDTYSTW